MYKNAIVLAAAVSCVSLLNCADSFTSATTHPTIYIDASFKDFEMEPIIHGITSWSRGTNNQINPTIKILLHEDIILYEKTGIFENTFFYVKESKLLNLSCPPGMDIDEGAYVGYTHRHGPRGVSFICLDADTLNEWRGQYFTGETARWATWSIVSAHEAGHALRLGHYPGVEAVMFPTIDVPSFDVTCVDIKNISNIWMLDIDEKCK